MLKEGGAEPGARLTCVVADLTSDAGWADAVAGCASVLHVASPFPPGVPKHEDDLILPAREGTLRVLRASRDAGVKRVVLTSSFAAVAYGQARRQAAFDETDWSDPASATLPAYHKSKTLAERAAWDFVAREGGALELSVVNPPGVFGPVLGPDFSSAGLIKLMLDGGLPAVPKLSFGVVDVRDVADLHLRAMTNPAAKGERFLAVAGKFMWMIDVANVLRARLGPVAHRVPTRQLPNWLVRIAALRNPTLRQNVPELGVRKSATNEKAQRLLGWAPRPSEDAIVATADSLLRLGLLKDGAPKGS